MPQSLKALAKTSRCDKAGPQHLQGNSIASLAGQIDAARIPTTHRVSAVEAENDSLRRQLAEAKKKQPLLGTASDDSAEEEARARAEAAARQKEAEEAAVMPNPINEYIEMLEEEVCCCFRHNVNRNTFDWQCQVFFCLI